MIVEVKGDATDPQRGKTPRIIVHCVSDNGRSYGKGFALQLAKKYPGAKEKYKMMHETLAFGGLVPLGLCIWWQEEKKDGIFICAIIAQHGLGKASLRLDALKAGLHEMATDAIMLNPSIHMPRIGCGLAGGNWEQVGPIVEKVFVLPLASLMDVYVYDLP